MSAQHTPGPYSVEEDFLDGDHLTNVCIPGKFGQPGQVIARCEHNWSDAVAGERRISWKEAEANAALFSASHDMLNTLEQLERWFDTDAEILDAMDEDTRADHNRQLAKIRAAIARTKGGAA